MYSVKEFKDIPEKLFNDWYDLWKRLNSTNFFNSPYWARCWEDLDNTGIRIFACYNNETLCGVVSLCIKRKYGIAFLTDIGDKYLDKSSILFDFKDTTGFFYLMQHLRKKGSLLLLEVREDLLGKFQFHKQLSEVASINPFIDLTQANPGNLNKKRKRKYIKTLANTPNLSVCVYRGKELQFALQNILEIEQRSNKNILKRGIFHQPVAITLFNNICNIAPDHVMIFIMNYDNSPIAHDFGLMCGNQYISYHTAYNKDHSRLKPGNLLLTYMIEYLKTCGCDTFDFSRGQTIQKSLFTNTKMNQFNLYYPSKFYFYCYLYIIIQSKNLFRSCKKILKSLILFLPGNILSRRFQELKKFQSKN